ncbi:hypothetical protein DPEC_G00196860 [Dallia pectoralis]|uniref:Uncharacterized protein n=1 Tax=Dallia pectoralis TaxID=75939 RepID=A0ACC2G7S2_DALPE|nr:hypothetical protein DPEC_G00196860 [Dallia pectoralis]
MVAGRVSQQVRWFSHLPAWAATSRRIIFTPAYFRVSDAQLYTSRDACSWHSTASSASGRGRGAHRALGYIEPGAVVDRRRCRHLLPPQFQVDEVADEGCAECSRERDICG